MLKTTSETAPRAADNSSFLTTEIKLAFLQLRQAFTEASILHHFDPERYIQIETNTSDYAIGGILSQLTAETWSMVTRSLFLWKNDSGRDSVQNSRPGAPGLS